MDQKKVIVVDDSAFMRMIISDMIESTDRYKVIARFKNGKELIDKVDDYKPDIITLDVEMPIMDGLTTLRELKKKDKKYSVIMLSSLTKKGSVTTMQCLEAGAVDFIEKANGSNRETMKAELINKIDAILESQGMSKVKIVHKNVEIKGHKKIDAVIVGASTGGPRALQQMLSKIDGDINIPVFVVQHMPKGFTKAFAERLDKICNLKVVEAEDGMAIEKNTIYIAQGGYHMTVGDGRRIKLNEEPAIWGVRPAVDKLFESAVKIYKGNLVSAILTGMGRDGATGCELVKDAGGVTISEDQSTCTIYGMPKAAYETGKIDLVLPLQEIGSNINKIIKGR